MQVQKDTANPYRLAKKNAGDSYTKKNLRAKYKNSCQTT